MGRGECEVLLVSNSCLSKKLSGNGCLLLCGKSLNLLLFLLGKSKALGKNGVGLAHVRAKNYLAAFFKKKFISILFKRINKTLNLKLNSASAFSHQYHIRADYYDILPADGELLTPAEKAAHALAAENCYAYKTACDCINFNVGHTTKTATVINVHDLFCT